MDGNPEDGGGVIVLFQPIKAIRWIKWQCTYFSFQFDTSFLISSDLLLFLILSSGKS